MQARIPTIQNKLDWCILTLSVFSKLFACALSTNGPLCLFALMSRPCRPASWDRCPRCLPPADSCPLVLPYLTLQNCCLHCVRSDASDDPLGSETSTLGVL